MTKIASAVFVLLGLFVPGSRADYIIKFIGESSEQTFEVTVKETETNQRIDFLDYSIIQTSSTDKAVVLLHASRIYFKVNLREIDRGNKFSTKTQEFKATGETETINGYQTREFKGRLGEIQITVFLTDTPTEKPYEKTMRNWINSPAAQNFNDLLAISDKLSGFPIQLVTEFPGTRLTFTFESAQETKIDDSELAIPNDYTDMSFAGSPLLELLRP